MVERRTRVLSTLVVILATISTVFGSATASAAELDEYLWENRPLLLFAPTDSDPRLAETVSRIEADRCDLVNRDVVIGVVVTDGGEKLRVNEIPDIQTILAVIDGMPMRIREMGVDPGQC